MLVSVRYMAEFFFSPPREDLWEATALRAGDFEKEVDWRGRHSRDGFFWFWV